jgi:hypothetical protein
MYIPHQCRERKCVMGHPSTRRRNSTIPCHLLYHLLYLTRYHDTIVLLCQQENQNANFRREHEHVQSATAVGRTAVTSATSSTSAKTLFVFADSGLSDQSGLSDDRLCFILCFVVAQNGVWKIYRLSSFFSSLPPEISMSALEKYSLIC